jgi:hypothetical protein
MSDYTYLVKIMISFDSVIIPIKPNNQTMPAFSPKCARDGRLDISPS